MTLDEEIELLLSTKLDDDNLEKSILEQKDLIHSIASKCRETSLFKNNIDNHSQFKELFKDDKDKIVKVYLWFLDRIVNAPTSLHSIGSVRLCIPVVDDFIMEKIGETNNTVTNSK